MANTSATGGYLTPTSPTPLDDLDLDLVFQAFIRGLTGLPGAMVRPRWQPTVPQTPGPTVDWCAVGVTPRMRSQDYPAIQHDQAGDGQDQYTRHQEIDVLVTFYGPHAMQYGGLLADGAYIPQNSEAIAQHDIKLVEITDAFAVPELVNEQWQRRYDVPMKFRRIIRRTYPVLNLLAAEAAVQSDTGPSADVTAP